MAEGLEYVLTEHVERDFGGHFACMECPNEMIGDIREFFGKFYKQ
jgi:hypothetical protein